MSHGIKISNSTQNRDRANKGFTITQSIYNMDSIDKELIGHRNGEEEGQFSLMMNMSPIFLRKKQESNMDKNKRHQSLETPVFRKPLFSQERDDFHDDSEKKTRKIGRPTYELMERSVHELNATKHDSTDNDYDREYILCEKDMQYYEENVLNRDATRFRSNHRVIPTVDPSFHRDDDTRSLNSDGPVSDEFTPVCAESDEYTQHSHQSQSYRYNRQLPAQVGTLNVLEMASFLEKTDTMIRRMETGVEPTLISKTKVINEVPSMPFKSRQIYDRYSWSSGLSCEQGVSKRHNVHEEAVLRMEQFVESQRENNRLRDRLLELQQRLERSEKENIKLHEQVKQLRNMNDQKEENNEEEHQYQHSLMPYLYEYSQKSLIDILKRITIHNSIIRQVTMQIELEYQRGIIKDNILLTALSYTFDSLMRSFIQLDIEFSSPFYSPHLIDNLSLPHFTDIFKDFIDLLSQDQYEHHYTQIKRFCVDNWISISNQPNYSHSYTKIIHDFASSIEKTIENTYRQDITCSLETVDIREGIEQMLMNLLGGSLLSQMIILNDPKNVIINRHIQILQFLQPSHLDVQETCVNHPLFHQAICQLQGILHCLSPCFQLHCLAETTKTLFSILGDEHSSADDFLPLFIYCIIQANVMNLQIITEYINQYRNPKELVMGDGYILVNLISALQFISSVDSSCLSINAIDYQLLYAAEEEKLRNTEKKRLSIF